MNKNPRLLIGDSSTYLTSTDDSEYWLRSKLKMRSVDEDIKRYKGKKIKLIVDMKEGDVEFSNPLNPQRCLF